MEPTSSTLKDVVPERNLETLSGRQRMLILVNEACTKFGMGLYVSAGLDLIDLHGSLCLCSGFGAVEPRFDCFTSRFQAVPMDFNSKNCRQ